IMHTVIDLGEDNVGPKIGPVFDSEIMFQPPDLSGGADNQEDEFIVLRNITGTAVSLFDPTFPANTWRIGGGLSFNFPMGVTLGAGNRLLLVSFAPGDAARLAAFRTRFAVSASIPVYGPWSGKLNNGADRIEILKPDAPVSGLPPYILVEAVDYQAATPWPEGADGTGASLQR